MTHAAARGGLAAGHNVVATAPAEQLVGLVERAGHEPAATPTRILAGVPRWANGGLREAPGLTCPEACRAPGLHAGDATWQCTERIGTAGIDLEGASRAG